jgi:predicted acylesterase/phospholipase RssA
MTDPPGPPSRGGDPSATWWLRRADLVLDGSGVTAMALVGAVEELDSAGYRFPRVSGSGIGAVVAALIAALNAAGRPLSELRDIVAGIDYTRFVEAPSGQAASGPRRLDVSRGLYPGAYLHAWLSGALAQIGVIRFGDLRLNDPDGDATLSPDVRYSLTLHVTDLTRRRAVQLPVGYPAYGVLDVDVQLIADAVRPSVATPFLFDPVRFPAPAAVLDGTAYPAETVTWVAGGLLTDFPVETWDRGDGRPGRWPTIGIKVAPRRAAAAEAPALAGLSDETLVGLRLLLENSDRVQLPPETADRTILVDAAGIVGTNFAVTEQEQETLFLAGREAVLARLAVDQPTEKPVSLTAGGYPAGPTAPPAAAAPPTASERRTAATGEHRTVQRPAPPDTSPRAAPAPASAAPPPPPTRPPPLPAEAWRGAPTTGSFSRPGATARPGSAAPPQERREPARVVSTGFATTATPTRALHPARPLHPGRDYVFWLEIGNPVERRIDTGPDQVLPLPPQPAGTRLRVALFSFPGSMECRPGADIGELVYLPDGSIHVARQPGGMAFDPAQGRLLFPVRTAHGAGLQRLRCSIYLDGMLLQSRLVEAYVGGRRLFSSTPSLRSVTDYSRTESLDVPDRDPFRPVTLSLMVNDNGGGNHGFRFFGTYPRQEPYKSDSDISAAELGDLLERGRRALRRSSWGSEAEATPQDRYRYGGAPDWTRFAEDIVRLAKAGYRLWERMSDDLARNAPPDGSGRTAADLLAELMRKPGTVEITTKDSLRVVLPAALVYDWPTDTNADLRVCPDALDALREQYEILERGESPSPNLSGYRCWEGNCYYHEHLDVVCPAGFWGMRHSIGLPPNLAGGEPGGATELPLSISTGGTPALSVAVSTDRMFAHRLEHQNALRSLHNPSLWSLAEDRATTLSMLKTAAPHVVYFLCHGGVDGTTPYLLVGDPETERPITRDNLTAYRIHWPRTRPLVFINGCHTAGLSPEVALDFVTAFVQKSAASGVIGTEVTVFEDLAVEFAMALLTAFVRDDRPLGEAMLAARQRLLVQANPLGLIYIAYAGAGLRLVDEPAQV